MVESRHPLCLFVAALWSCVAPPPTTSTAVEAYPDGVTAFVDVSVLSMERGLPAPFPATVVIADGRILDVAPPGVALPDTATVIPGEGRTLMPGLIDAHVHVWYEGELTLLLANGVTSARNLFGDPLQRAWRNEIARGDRIGPALVTSGPIVDGWPPSWPTSDVVASPDEAAGVVRRQRRANYDLVKVYNSLSASSYMAILDAAAAEGVPVSGHVPWDVGWDAVVRGPQVTIEHLDGLVDRVGQTGRSTFLYDVSGMTEAMDARDDALLQEASETAAADGVVLVPTLVVFDRFLSEAEAEQWRTDPRMQYVHPDVAAAWAVSPQPDPPTLQMLDRYALELQDYTRALHDAGATVALGTDANNAYVIPGFSVHDELALLVEAGLSPTDALAAATVGAAAALGRPEVGTIEAGQVADLLLLEADPTQDVAHVERRVGVMAAGAWHSEAALQQRLVDLAASYLGRRAPPPSRVPACRHAP